MAVLHSARDLGVTHIDTSDAYGPGVANDLIRLALHPYPPELVVATKVGVVRDQSRAFVAADTPAQLREQVEVNLHRLGADHLDVVYLRVGGDGLLPPGETPLVEAFGALAELRQQGSIRHLGLSGVSVAQLDEARGVAPVVAVQNRYHLLDRTSADVLVACEQHGIAFVPYFPLAAGLLDPNLDTSQMPPGMGLTDEQDRQLADRARPMVEHLCEIVWTVAQTPTTPSATRSQASPLPVRPDCRRSRSAPTRLTYAVALDEALCSGWIDGHSKRVDADTFRQRFTPRRTRSLWSARNVEHAARLTEEGRMRPRGLAEVERAQADGCWAQAYRGPATIEMPDDSGSRCRGTFGIRAEARCADL